MRVALRLKTPCRRLPSPSARGSTRWTDLVRAEMARRSSIPLPLATPVDAALLAYPPAAPAPPRP